jgi:hypothetical protein
MQRRFFQLDSTFIGYGSYKNKSNLINSAIGTALFGLVLLTSQPAQALPSFARQTGQACGACHTDFPQLTPFGRRFKLGGYTLGGGRDSDQYKKTFGSSQWVPPISFMGQITFEQSKSGQGGNPDSPGFLSTLSAPQGSIFYGGSITDELGAFVQGTLNSSGAQLDLTDIRYVKNGTLFGKDALFGITVNNNPTVQDVWNTTPVWSMPGISPSIAPKPMASTALDAGWGGKVLGVGVYTFIDDTFYIEASAYKGFSQRWQNTLVNANNFSNDVMDRVSPYVRIAAEPHWGNHWLMFGGFWMSSSRNPLYIDDGSGFQGGSDKFVDLGVDSQYQYMGGNYVLTLRAIYINERQKLDATFLNGGSDNPTNTLNSFKAQVSFAWNTAAPGNKWVFTGGYFNTWGSTDCGLYNGTVGGCGTPPANSSGPITISNSLTGSPNSDGFIADIAWFPYAMSSSPLWPYFNARVGLQYIWYNKFNGASTNYDGYGRNASDNNTLLAYLWFAM